MVSAKRPPSSAPSAAGTLPAVNFDVARLAEQFGPLVYLVLFAAFLFQVGFLIGPILPGNPILFATGILTVGEKAVLNPFLCVAAVAVGAFLGNHLNYFQGRAAGPLARKGRFAGRIAEAEKFFGEHGDKAVAVGSFIPFIRAFVPFVAGMTAMPLRRFLLASVIGSIGWPALGITIGSFMGRIPFIRDNAPKIWLAVILFVGTVAIVKALATRKSPAAAEESIN